jgi:hypothetical protein
MMKRALIEATVVAAVEAVLAGGKVEDERIECKSYLLPPENARQLAGSANAALGEDVIWIIGIDEDAGTLVPLNHAMDLADWTAKLFRAFDDNVAPDLTSLSVPVPGGNVLALHFQTDRAPYVLRNPKGGSPELEVPWREGSRTRSAKRHELLKMLLPTVHVPVTTVLSCDGLIESGQAELKFCADIKIYVEHLQAAVCVFPTHLMSATLKLLGIEYPLQVGPIPQVTATVDYGGLDAVQDGVYCRQPGTMRLTARGDVGRIFPTTDTMLQSLKRVTLAVQLAVSGGSRAIKHDIELYSQFDERLGPTARVPLTMKPTVEDET